MRILVIGSGGREHALCLAIKKSPFCNELYCAPGNAGIAQVAICIPIDVDDVDGIVRFAYDNEINYVVIGPEVPLVLGLSNKLAKIGIKSFGPSKEAAILEGSKGFMKDLCSKYNIPTAKYKRFNKKEAAKEYLYKQGAPIVVKVDGLAAGKGVTVAKTIEEAEAAIDSIFNDDIESELVIEECLKGEEASIFALVDSKSILMFASAQDHKAVGEGDEGLNTGGMGAYSPAPIITKKLEQQILEEILGPTVAAMKAEGRPYSGVLYAGLMLTNEGPKLLEYNVRFGDPECQVLMARLKSDFLSIMLATSRNKLYSVKLEWNDQTALVVVLAAQGYPGKYERGSVIKNIDKAGMIFHAGTKWNSRNELVSDGGRVLGVTALGNNVAEAQAKAYNAVDEIDWPEGFCRRDIGWRAIGR